MRRFRAHSESDSKVISETVPIPKCNPDEVLIHGKAISLGSIDRKLIIGNINHLPDALTKGSHVGFDIAGIIIDIGSNVASKSFKKGNNVYSFLGFENGSDISEYVAVSYKYIGHMRKEMSYEEASSFPTICMSAIQSYFNYGGFREKSKILILGAGSCVGMMGVQIARHFNAEIWTTSGPSHHIKLHELGVKKILNYDLEWKDQVPEDYFDTVYDCVGGNDLWDIGKKALREHGHFVTLVGDKKEVAETSAHTKLWNFAMRNITTSRPKYYRQITILDCLI